MRLHIVAAAALLIVAAALAGCGSSTLSAGFSGSGQGGTITAARYASMSQVVAALKHGGLACTGGNNNAPVVSGARSETLCNFTPSEQALIDVFPGTVSTATVLRNSVSTGTEQIWSDVGLNWWVQTSHPYSKKVQTILGGRIIAGPWHPQATPPPAQPSAASAPLDAAVTVCQEFNGIYSNLSADLKADANDPSALSPDSNLNNYADNMLHWSYVVNQAVDNGTTSATVQFANDLGDAGVATVQVAEPLPGVTPDVESAIVDVDAVQRGCSALAG
jgi:hypothetical protein